MPDIRVKGGGKVGIDELNELKRIDFSFEDGISTGSALYNYSESDFRYDFIVNNSEDASRLFVFFSGTAMRSRYQIPVFQRWRWAGHFPGNTMYISDPTLYLDDALELAWYVGTDQFDPISTISRLIKSAADDMNIPLDRVTAYGSSGGGFMALRLALYMPDINVITINPQIDISRYEMHSVEKFFRICFSGIGRKEAADRYGSRINLLQHSEEFSQRRIVYIQNTMDEHHLKEHFGPFAEKIGLNENNNFNSKYISAVFFSDPKGHAAAEPPEALMAALAIIQGSELADDHL